MKLVMTILFFIIGLTAQAQIVQGCPGCPKLYTGEWTEEEYKKMAELELVNLSTLDREITSAIRTAWRKKYPQSKIQIKSIIDAYTLLALTDATKTTVPLQPEFCEECAKVELSIPMLLDAKTKEQIQQFIKSKFRPTYLYQRYRLSQKEMTIFTKGMSEIAGVK